MTEEIRDLPGPFSERRYKQGFRHATEDLLEEGIEYAERTLAEQLAITTWYTIGYRTALNAFKEGQAI